MVIVAIVAIVAFIIGALFGHLVNANKRRTLKEAEKALADLRKELGAKRLELVEQQERYEASTFIVFFETIEEYEEEYLTSLNSSIRLVGQLSFCHSDKTTGTTTTCSRFRNNGEVRACQDFTFVCMTRDTYDEDADGRRTA